MIDIAITDPSTEDVSATSPLPKRRLGAVQTPHGQVVVRRFRRPRRDRGVVFGMELFGPLPALKWMLPTWVPRGPTEKTQIFPKQDIHSEDKVTELYNLMADNWGRRLGVVLDKATTPEFSAAAKPPGNSPLKTEYWTLNDLRDVVGQEIASGRCRSTYKAYGYQWAAMFRYIDPNLPYSEVTRPMVQQAVGRMRDEGVAPATIRHQVKALGRLLNRAIEDENLRKNPTKRIVYPREPERMARFLNMDQRERFLLAAEAHSPDAHLLVALGVYLGLRKAELLSVQWQHLTLEEDGGWISVMNQGDDFISKNGKIRTIPICRGLRKILVTHKKAQKREFGFVLKPRQAYKDGKRYRWEFRGLFERLVRDAVMPAWTTPHTMRHTFASIAIQHNVPIFKLSLWLGHWDISVTKIYVKQ